MTERRTPDQTQVMGIVNVTPDSFSDGGQHFTTESAIAHGRALLAEGADYLDIGGESTRPGAREVSETEELERVVPVIEALANDAEVSVDTSKEAVARDSVAAGAKIINDVSSSLYSVAADLGVPMIAMHMQGSPRTMQQAPTYDPDVVTVVRHELAGAIEQGNAVGVPQMMIDPGIGFGKTAAHNMALLASLETFVDLGVPVVLGVSRKSLVGAIHGRSDSTVGPPIESTPENDRLEGSLALATAGAMHGVAIVRVHDVRATVHAMRVVGAVPIDRRGTINL